jgi:hypothetical protein
MKAGAANLNKDARLSINKTSELTWQEQEYLNQNPNTVIPDMRYMFAPVHFSDLKDLTAFTLFLEKASNGVKPTQQSIVQAIQGLKGHLSQPLVTPGAPKQVK